MLLLMLCTLILYAASIHMYGTVLFLLLTKEKDTRVELMIPMVLDSLTGFTGVHSLWLKELVARLHEDKHFTSFVIVT
jgi:hypothetical protein